MKPTKTNLNRRRFLRSTAGATLALPFLESIPLFADSGEKQNLPAKSCVFIGYGFGVTKDNWFPDAQHQQTDYQLTPGLKPLERHRDDFTVIQNLTNLHTFGAHSGSFTYLTGANLKKTPGIISNSISCDQLLAERVGMQTRFDDIRIKGSHLETYGHSQEGAPTLSFDRQGRSVDGEAGALGLYQKMFGSPNEDPGRLRYQLSRKKSILDGLLEDLKRVQRGVSQFDRDQMDQYLTSIREIERQLVKAEKWIEVPLPKPTIPNPDQGLPPTEEIKLTYDLMALALQSDLTRVLTYRHPIKPLLDQMNAQITTHNMSHHGAPDSTEFKVSLERDKMNAELFAHMLDRFKTTKFVDGSSLLDHSTIAWGTALRIGHGTRDVPMVVAGRGGGSFRHGSNLIYKSNETPLSNLWLTMLKNMDERIDSFAESDGLLGELHA